MKYVILAYSDNIEPFVFHRQFSIVGGETLIGRTVRLLKKNKVKEVYITSKDERYDAFNAIRYEPKFNDYKPKEGKGYWLSAFPIEILNEPVTFLLGDVYYSEKAIEKIVNTSTDRVLFFCSYKNKDPNYIKKHDEPFAFKVVDYKTFKEHIEIVKKLYDEEKTSRHPIAWELYRSLNGIDVNVHIMTVNYVAINDITCDVDRVEDVELLNKVLER